MRRNPVTPGTSHGEEWEQQPYSALGCVCRVVWPYRDADNCGHHFCGSCMERWMGNAAQGECPVCRAPVNKLVPVLKMDEVTLWWIIATNRSMPTMSERRVKPDHWEDQKEDSRELVGTGFWWSVPSPAVGRPVVSCCKSTSICMERSLSGDAWTTERPLMHGRWEDRCNSG